MNKKLSNTIIICLIAITISMVYYYAIRPIRKDWKYARCLDRTWDEGKIYKRGGGWKASDATKYWIDMCIKQYK